MKALSCRSTATSMFKKNCLALLVGIVLSSSVHAQQASAKTQYAISSGELVQVVNEISRNSGLQIVYDIDDLQGIRAVDVKGKLTVQQALDKALKGTTLSWTQVNPTTISIKKKAQAPHRPSQQDTSTTPPSASSRSVDSDSDVQELDKMVVVGSRLGVMPTDSALPIRVISREDIEMSGAGSIAQVLGYLPEVSVSNGANGEIGNAAGFESKSINASSVQLRGLPLGTTLILIDGRRSGESSALASAGLFDLSTIPLAMVDRIEVLPAGASAVYGGDGLAGVINIVLRKDAEVRELRIRSLGADGYSEEQVSGVWGKSWSRGSISVMSSWGKNGSLTTAERDLTADRNYERFGGFDRRSPYYPGLANVYSLNGCPPEELYCFVPLNERGNLPGTNSSYATVRAGQDGSDLDPSDFVSGELSYGDIESKFRTNEKNFSTSISGKFQVTDSLEVFADVLFNKREIPSQEQWVQVILGEYGWEQSIVSADNPFNPFDVDVGVDYYLPNTNVATSYTQKHLRLTAGARGTWAKAQWDVSVVRGTDRTKFEGPGAFDPELVAQALRSSDPDRALNVFRGDGGLPASQELLDSLVSTFDQDQGTDNDSFSGYIRGPVLSLPAGDLHALVGAEYQRTSYKSAYLGNARVQGDDTARAYFAEARAPILESDSNSQKRDLLAITGAYRREKVSRSDDVANTGTFGVEYRPSESVLIRSTYSDAFKPIIAYGSYLPPNPSTFPFTVSDPQFEGREFSVYPITGGGVPPGLRPETSSNMTLGLVWNPSANLRASVTMWTSRIKDKFLILPGSREDFEYIINNESQYPGRVIRDPETGFIEYVDLRVINVSSIRLTGADLILDGRMETPVGDVVASIGATYTHTYDESRFPGSPVESRVSVIGNAGWAPRWKIVPRFVWHPSEAVSASIIGRYISEYRDTLPLATGPNAGQLLTFGNSWIVDVSVGVDLQRWIPRSLPWLEGTRLRLNVNNVENKLPEFCNGCGGGFDATQSDMMGRTVSAELVMNF